MSLEICAYKTIIRKQPSPKEPPQQQGRLTSTITKTTNTTTTTNHNDNYKPQPQTTTTNTLPQATNHTP